LSCYVVTVILYYARWQHRNKKNSSKMKIYTTTEEKLKKNNKIKIRIRCRASPNGPLNIYVADMPRKT